MITQTNCAMALVASLLVGIGTARAGWTVVILHPPEAFSSTAHDVQDGVQAGSVTNMGARAGTWTGTADSFVALQQTAGHHSTCLGMDSQQIVGDASGNSVPHGALWTGGSYANIYPFGASGALSVDAGQQVGWVIIGAQMGTARAALWHGSGVPLDLSPPGATESRANGVHAGRQVGSALFGSNYVACSWTGTAASWVNFNPPGATGSIAYDIHEGQVVGVASGFGDPAHAGYWTSTPDSWVDLHPGVGDWSEANRVYGGWQVGRIRIDGVFRACIWHNTAASWQNLSLSLPALPEGSWGWSEANGVWTDGKTLQVVGFAMELPINRARAILWTRELLPCPNDVDGNMQVNINDLLNVIANWGAGAGNPADVNGDGIVNIVDLLAVIAGWGTCS